MKQFTDSTSSFIPTGRATVSRIKKASSRAHSWVTVIDPTNHRSLLQACDDCGVVKSENSVIRNCAAPSGQALLSSAKSAAMQIAI